MFVNVSAHFFQILFVNIPKRNTYGISNFALVQVFLKFFLYKGIIEYLKVAK